MASIEYAILLHRLTQRHPLPSAQSHVELGTMSGLFPREVRVVFWNVVEDMFQRSDDLADVAKRQTRSPEVECK